MGVARVSPSSPIAFSPVGIGTQQTPNRFPLGGKGVNKIGGNCRLGPDKGG